MKKCAAFVLGALLLAASPARADLVVLDFNEFTTPFLNHPFGTSESAWVHSYTTYTDGGLILSPVTLMESDFANHDHEANLASVSGRTNPLVAVNGTGIMRPASGAFTITGNGTPFSVLSMNLLMGFDNGFPGASAVTFEGYLSGALTGSLTVPLNWHGSSANVPRPDGVVDGWTYPSLGLLGNVDELVVRAVPRTEVWPGGAIVEYPEFWVDNIRVHRTPEPSTLLFIGLGATLAIRRRLRFAKRR